jgi:hypothetical protein
MDFGLFTTIINGHTVTLRDFTLWLVGRCKAGDPDAADIREIIYTPDGKTVQRYDRLGIRSTGDSSHLTHTHVSLFRDSVKVNRASMVNLIKKYLAGIGSLAGMSSNTEDDMPLDGLDRAQVNNSERYLQSIFGLTDHAVGISDTVNSHDLPSPFVAAFRQLLADVNELKTRPAGSITLACRRPGRHRRPAGRVGPEPGHHRQSRPGRRSQTYRGVNVRGGHRRRRAVGGKRVPRRTRRRIPHPRLARARPHRRTGTGHPRTAGDRLERGPSAVRTGPGGAGPTA